MRQLSQKEKPRRLKGAAIFYIKLPMGIEYLSGEWNILC